MNIKPEIIRSILATSKSDENSLSKNVKSDAFGKATYSMCDIRTCLCITLKVASVCNYFLTVLAKLALLDLCYFPHKRSCHVKFTK